MDKFLNKREGYRKAFKNFKPSRVAKMTPVDVEKLLQNPNIIRNRLKIISTITNAQAFLKIQKEFGSFSNYMWNWVNYQPIINKHQDRSSVPAITDLAVAMAKDLKKRGFKFLGPTVWYAHMQAVGMVNDHTTDCFRHKEVNHLIKKTNLKS